MIQFVKSKDFNIGEMMTKYYDKYNKFIAKEDYDDFLRDHHHEMDQNDIMTLNENRSGRHTREQNKKSANTLRSIAMTNYHADKKAMKEDKLRNGRWL